MPKDKLELLIKNLPDWMIEEFNEAKLIPYPAETIEKLIKVFKAKHFTKETFGYDDFVSLEIKKIYSYLQETSNKFWTKKTP